MNVHVKYNDLNYIDITFNSGHDKMIYIYIYKEIETKNLERM